MLKIVVQRIKSIKRRFFTRDRNVSIIQNFLFVKCRQWSVCLLCILSAAVVWRCRSWMMPSNYMDDAKELHLCHRMLQFSLSTSKVSCALPLSSYLCQRVSVCLVYCGKMADWI